MAKKTVGAVECTMPVLLALVTAKSVWNERLDRNDIEAGFDFRR
jgi:hypothetical protein